MGTLFCLLSQLIGFFETEDSVKCCIGVNMNYYEIEEDFEVEVWKKKDKVNVSAYMKKNKPIRISRTCVNMSYIAIRYGKTHK